MQTYTNKHIDYILSPFYTLCLSSLISEEQICHRSSENRAWDVINVFHDWLLQSRHTNLANDCVTCTPYIVNTITRPCNSPACIHHSMFAQYTVCVCVWYLTLNFLVNQFYHGAVIFPAAPTALRGHIHACPRMSCYCALLRALQYFHYPEEHLDEPYGDWRRHSAFHRGKGCYLLLFGKPVESLISWSNIHISLQGCVLYSDWTCIQCFALWLYTCY